MESESLTAIQMILSDKRECSCLLSLVLKRIQDKPWFIKFKNMFRGSNRAAYWLSLYAENFLSGFHCLGRCLDRMTSILVSDANGKMFARCRRS